VEKGTPGDLAWVISKLDPSNLNAVLRADTNTILKLLVEKGTPRHLAWVLEQLNSADLKKMLDEKILDSEHLVAALVCFNPEALNTLLATAENGVLECLKKSPQHLLWVFEQLNPDALNTLLKPTENGILKCLEEAAQGGNTESLALVLSRLDPSNLNEVLRADTNTILNLLVEKGTPRHLAWVLEQLNSADLKKMLDEKALDSKHLAAALVYFNPEARNTLLTTAENGILKCLVEAAKNGNAEPLAWVLEWLNPADLKKMLDENALNLEHLVLVLTKHNPAALKELLATTEN
jgi:Mg/Co/Ni transporter MgtE